MIRGLYTAASGMMVEAARQETISNNLANSETTGFKKDLATQRSFPERPITRIGDGKSLTAPSLIGTLGLGALVSGIHTSYEQGNMLESGNPLDIAILGEGFLVVDTPQGERLTRNGAFSLDADRFLVTCNGERVLGVDGPLRIPEGEFSINGDGRVLAGEVPVGQLLLVNVDSSQLRKAGNSLFAEMEGTERSPFTGQVRQNFLETANVDVLDEVIRMMTALRSYETNQRMVQAQDEILGKAVNEVGKL